MSRVNHINRARALAPLLAVTVAVGCRGNDEPHADPAPRPQAIEPVAGLADPEIEPRRAIPGLERLDEAGQEGWYGIYLMGNKVGHGHMWMRATRDGEPGGYTVGFAMNMAVQGGGQKNELGLEEHRFYGGEHPHPLIESRFKTSAKAFVDERTATPTGDGKMRIRRVLGGKAEPERVVAGTVETLEAQLTMSPLTLAEEDVGKTETITLWSWEREADEELSVAFVAMDERQRAGVAERVGRFEATYKATGIKGTVLITGDGTLLEMTLGSSLLLKLEERAIAESGVAGLDILGTSVKSPVRLGRPEAIGKLRLEVSGPADLKLASSRVRVVEELSSPEDGQGRWRMIITRGLGDEVAAADREAALASDATIDVEHPTIVERAKALTAEAKSARDKVKAVADWVYQTLDKKLATHLPTASRVLEDRVGDCTEHTWLTVALLRAVGIPARPLYGIAYTGDGEAAFAYHAWVEVAVPDGQGTERWLAIDPTWGEAEADATHISLGSTLGEVAASIGGLVIERAEVLEP